MSTYRSNVILILVLAVAFVVLQLSQAQSDIYGQKTDTKHKYCGKHLSSALQLLCNGVYNSMFKKNGHEMEADDYPYAYDYPMTSRANANAMMGRFGGMRLRRQSPSRGVHDECCVNACTIDELASYCAH